MLDRSMSSLPADSQDQRGAPAANSSRAVVATSPALDQTIKVVVCVPCFRRPDHLRKTLQSLADQVTSRRFAVVMVENDASACASVPVVGEFLRDGKLAGLCVVEPQQGNCRAINAAFETALETFPNADDFLMIDDDEIAAPDWLELMLRAAERTEAGVIGGPVLQRFDDEAGRGLERHPAFRPAYHASGPVPIIYGCGNCLIKRTVFERLGSPAFDLRFNFLGGGDVDFFTRARRQGVKFHWLAEAVITETVPAARTRPGWIALRGLRIGAINYLVQRKAAQTPWLRVRLAAKVLALLPLSLIRAGRLALTEHKALIALHPVIVAAGGLLAAIGVEPQPYKASKTAP
jgi:GT2 family glycosyltransferase